MTTIAMDTLDDVSTACPDDMSILSSPERCTRLPVTPDVNLNYEEPAALSKRTFDIDKELRLIGIQC
jgi:hypothetical protein